MTLADRQKALYEQMRKEKRHLYDGKVYESSADTDVSRHWRSERRNSYAPFDPSLGRESTCRPYA